MVRTMQGQHVQTRSHQRRTPLALLAITTVLQSACFDSAAVSAPPVHLAGTHVTDAVAATLSADGRFILPAAVVNPVGQINEAQARAIASRYVSDVSQFRVGEWSASHGATIDPTTLKPCDRALYAASPYAAVTGPSVSEITIRTFNAHWVVPMCGRSGNLQIVVSFSALATELTPNLGTTKIVPWALADASSFGVPAGVATDMYSPEGATLFTFKKSGKRVSSIPELIMTPMPKAPALIRWRIDLENPVTVVGTVSQSVRQRGRLFVGFDDTFRSSGLLDLSPQATAPQTSWIDAVTRTPFTVVLAANAPAQVELVTGANP